MKIMLIFFSKKILVWGKRTILGPKMEHPHNFGSALRIFFKFCITKGVNKYLKILLVVFEKKFHRGQFVLFTPFSLFNWALPKLSQATVTIGSSNTHDFFHDYYWIFKQSEHD